MASKKLTTLKPRVAAAPTLAQARGLQTIGAGGWRTEGMSAAARGYDRKWRKAREDYLRLHPLCVMCETAGQITSATVVDHKIPHHGDRTLFWDRHNWQALCAPHHDGEKKRQESRAGGYPL
jgi:5-methylcytosine-specific restriction enzyme A